MRVRRAKVYDVDDVMGDDIVFFARSLNTGATLGEPVEGMWCNTWGLHVVFEEDDSTSTLYPWHQVSWVEEQR